MKTPAGRPRVIRKIMRRGKDGRVKVARDRKACVQIERVKAKTAKTCQYHACPRERLICSGTEHAVLTRLDGEGPQSAWMFIRGMMIAVKYDYHFECVPPNARRLLRFFE